MLGSTALSTKNRERQSGATARSEAGKLPRAADQGTRNARDLALIQRIQLQDRAAFKELYLIYHTRLARFLTRITTRYDVAEEIINDTFWVVWTRAGDFRNASRVSTWIMGIAYRRGLKTLRKLSIVPIAEGTPEAEAPYEEPAQQAELEQWLDIALERLPIEQRLVLELAYHLGHSCEEIAEIVQCPVNTVKTRMHYAREKLRRLLPELAGACEGGKP